MSFTRKIYKILIERKHRFIDVWEWRKNMMTVMILLFFFIFIFAMKGYCRKWYVAYYGITKKYEKNNKEK